jgi:hypothetical protein
LAGLARAFAEASVPVVLVGGYAVVTWGVPRATFDIDVLVDADEVGLQRCLRRLEANGVGVEAAYLAGWRDQVRDMPLVKALMFRDGRSIASDLFPVVTPLQRSAVQRARAIRLPGIDAQALVVSPADLVLFKLMADRPKDRVDIQNVLTVQGVPDADYLRAWAQQLGVADRLARALGDAGLPPLG